MNNTDIQNKVFVIFYLPTQAVCSWLGTSSPALHLMHLSSTTSMESSGQPQNSGFADVGILSPGQMP